MPLVNAEPSNIENSLGEAKQVLLDFVKKIEACIDDSDWEALSAILESRQKYLEQLFKRSIPLNARNALIQLAQSILQQDVDFQARIKLQKDLIARRQSSIVHGRRAIDVYNSR